MSEVENALTGAEVAPVENTAPTPEQTQASTESATEQVETQAQDDKPRDEKGRFVPQERVNEITKARREAERRADSLERELHQYRTQQPAQYQPQSNEAPPTLADFGFDMDKFGEALTHYAVRKAESSAEQRFQQQSQRQHQQSVEQQFEQRSQEYAKAHPDFDDAVSDLGRAVQFHPAVVEAIGFSERGPEIVHHLAKHLDEADRLARMPPHLAAVQLGRIEAQLSTPKAKPVTKAPTPAPVLGGGGKSSPSVADGMSYAEYRAAREKGIG